MTSRKRKIDTLTAQKINGIKANGKRQQFYDGNYLYLFVSATGKKSFYLKGYKLNGKVVNQFSIGEYRPSEKSTHGEITLKQARDKVREITNAYRDGIDYQTEKKEKKRLDELAQANTFSDWFSRYLETKKTLKASTFKPLVGRAEQWIIPRYGNRPINCIKRRELIEYLTEIGEKHNKYTTRNKVANIMHGVFELALNHEVIDANPCANIVRALPKKPPEQHHPALTKSSDIAKLAYDIYIRDKGTVEVNALVRFSLHTMLRPKEARSLQWDYVDFDDEIIRLPYSEIKTAEYHVVPMSQQVKALLLALHEITGLDDYVFSMPDNQDGFPSENAVNSVLHSLGYKGKQVAHGFRTTASSQLNESGKFSSDAIEKQLAHNDKSQIRAVYNRADYIKERREMLQYWSDTIGRLRLDRQREQARAIVDN